MRRYMYKITPKKTCTLHQLRAFYMHADGIVPKGWRDRPSTTVPFWRLQVVMSVVHQLGTKKYPREKVVYRT